MEVQIEAQDDRTFKASVFYCEPHLLTQNDLNDLVRDLKLPKKQHEFLRSRLKSWNHLQNDTFVS